MSKLAAAGLSRTVAGPLPPGVGEGLAGERVGAADGLVERRPRAPCGRGRRPGSPPRGAGRSRRSGPPRPRARRRPGRAPARSTPLSRPPAISTIGGSKARSAAMTASGWVPCESLTKRTPSTIATGSRRCSTPVNAAAAARIASGATPNSRPTATAASAFETLWAPGMASSRDRHDPAAGAGRRRPAAGDRRAARRRRPRSSRRPRRGRRRRAAARADRATTARRADVGVRRRRPGRRALSTSAPAGSTSSASRRLTAPVGLQRAVPVEVVGGDVGVDRDRRAARQGRQLQLGQLVRRPGAPGVSSGSRSTSGIPMLPPRTTGWAGSAARIAAVSDDVVVLPFVPVTPIVGAGQSRRKRSGLGHERPGRSASPAAPRVDERPERRAEARLGRRVVGVDRRRRRHERGPGPGRRRVDVRAQQQADRPSLERRDRARPARRPAGRRRPSPRAPASARKRARAIPLRASPRTVTGRSRSAPARTPSSVRRVEIDRAGRRSSSITPAGSARRGRASRRAAPRGSPTIQNRIVIFSSSQPPSSKWWWSGLIRKIRLPPLSLK